MRISRLAPNWIFPCAALGLLALTTTSVGATPITQHRRADEAVSVEHARDVRADDLVRRELILAATMGDPVDQRGTRRGTRGGGRAPIELPENLGRRDVDASPIHPVPEPRSTLLFAAGAGLVAFVVRRKLF